MKLLADEGVDRQIVDRLRSEGHNVSYVADMTPGIPDEEALALANHEERTLLTADKDFGELVFRQGMISTGVVLARLAGLSPERKANVVSLAIAEHSAELSTGVFAVIAPGVIRIRAR